MLTNKEKIFEFKFRDAVEESNTSIYRHLGFGTSSAVILDTDSPLNIQILEQPSPKNIVNLRKVNDISNPNDLFLMVNQVLPAEGIFVCRVETYNQRKRRLYAKYPKFFAIPYITLDFIFKRVFPKLKITKQLYFFITADRNRVMSLTETLGRLAYCGFRIIDIQEKNNLTQIIAKKNGEPQNTSEPSTGLLIKLHRLVKGGRLAPIYKFRTMHPYAQYIQDYVYEQHSLQSGGKFADDFRITGWGKILRKYWLDELPMLINWFKGDLKLVGVRPLSAQYASLYTEELRVRRSKYKPGLLPPFYADMPQTIEEIMDSENKYLLAYEIAPRKTDLIYLFRILKNILLKNSRSG